MPSPVPLSWLLASASPGLERRAEPGWYLGDVFYEIYVRSFADSNGDGHGDLRGVIDKLDDIEALGVTALWLMPIFEGPSLHGYAVADHDRIEADYGTMEDALALFDSAHRRGMAVILDYVPNHVSREHPWFPAAAVWSSLEPVGWGSAWNPQGGGTVWTRHPSGRWYYHAFTADMPDLNLRDRATRENILGVADRWIERGADGFRVDAVRYLYEDGPGHQADQLETFAFVSDLRKRLDRTNAMMVVEAWAERGVAARYGSAGAHLTFDFDRAYALRRALDASDASILEDAVRASEESAIAWATFVTNHDSPVPRAASFGRRAAIAANAAILLGGGVPFLYQGDELGQRGIDEEQVRRPYRWSADPSAGFTSGKPWQPIGGRDEGDHLEAQRADPASVWSRTRDLIALRNKHPALVSGSRTPLPSSAKSVWAFSRTLGEERILAAVNLSERSASVTLDHTKIELAPYDFAVIEAKGSRPSRPGSGGPTRRPAPPTRSGSKPPTAP
jgi:glycosidase